MRRVPVAAKINLALVVGERRADGLHDVATVLQRVDLCDRLTVEPSRSLAVDGFRGDTLVGEALAALAAEAGTGRTWRVRLDKTIPVAAGLGGGSADAGAALRLANETLASPLSAERLGDLARRFGADVPFFLASGPKLAEGTGERLRPLDLPQDYWVLIALPIDAEKSSTGDVYARFDALGGGSGFSQRKTALLEALASCRRPRDLASLPANDLAEAAGSTELVARLGESGAFRADVSGAGPAVYGLFHRRDLARAAARELRPRVRTWVVAPVW